MSRLRRGDFRRARRVIAGRQRSAPTANMLTLTAPEMPVLIGGMRVLNANLG
jgi:catalase (peroxidase I)